MATFMAHSSYVHDAVLLWDNVCGKILDPTPPEVKDA